MWNGDFLSDDDHDDDIVDNDNEDDNHTLIAVEWFSVCRIILSLIMRLTHTDKTCSLCLFKRDERISTIT